MSKVKTWAQILWSKVDTSGSSYCWQFIGPKDKDGYGKITRKIPGTRKHIYRRAHRIAYEVTKGPIPKGSFVCHSCDNPGCCNPAHLWLGTAKDNNIDCRNKGRNPGNKKFSTKDIDLVFSLQKTGHSHRQIAFYTKISKTQIGRILRSRQ